MMNCKVMYHIGEGIGLKTKVMVGRLSLEPDRLVIRGEKVAEVLFSAIQSVELFRLHGTGRMLKIAHKEGTLYVTVIRLCLFGCFAMVNFFATGKLRRLLEERIPQTDSA